MSASAAVSLFEKAVSPDENSQFEFACNVDIIIHSFPAKFIAQEFFQFLATWIPRNNLKIVSELARKVDILASVPEAVASFAPVVESLLASENKQVAKTIRDKLKASSLGGDWLSFFRSLAASPLDYVRSFVPSILDLLPSLDDKRTICSTLIYDAAFKVRLATCSIIPTLPTELGQQIALSLCNDPSGFIKAYLPVVCTPMPFWFSIVPKLINDHDWSVRASIAKALTNATDIQNALTIATQLAEDNLWQVNLCALKSITKIISKNAVKDSDLYPRILEALIRLLSYPQTSLKNVVIDTFLAIYSLKALNQEKVVSFVNDIITKQPPNTRLHFINALSSGKYSTILAIVHDNLQKVVVSLMRSDQWRVRLGIVNALSTLSDDPELRKSFSDLCLQALGDEAAPVREAAAEELAKFFIANPDGKLLPEYFADLKQSQTFRKRQAALILLKNIAKSSTTEEKEKIVDEMKAFENDPCNVVADFAKKCMEEAQK
jgi:HEAT repeat protein